MPSYFNANVFPLFFRWILDFGFQKKSVLKGTYVREVHQREKEIRLEQKDDARFPDYGDDYDDYVQKRRRRLFSVVADEFKSISENTTGTRLNRQDRQKETHITQNVSQPQPESQRPVEPVNSAIKPTSKHLLQLNQSRLNIQDKIKRTEPLKPNRRSGRTKRVNRRSVETAGGPKPVTAVGNEQHHVKEAKGPKHSHIQTAEKMKLKDITHEAEGEDGHIVNPKKAQPGKSFIQRDTDTRKHLREKEIEMNVPLQQNVENGIHNPVMTTKERNEKKWSELKDEALPIWAAEEDSRDLNKRENKKLGRQSVWGIGGDFEGMEEEDPTPPPVFDTDVNWSQTFQVNHLDLQAHRSDWIDLRCNVSGNLLLEASDALPIAKAFVEKLNEKHQW